MTVLDKLAECRFIEAEFRDARGEVRRTTPATQRALLAAMGVPAGTDTEAAAALAALDRAEWGRPLPPVRVAYAGAGPVTADLTLPAGTGWIDWRVELEDGNHIGGTVAFASLKLTAVKDLDGRVFHRRTLVLGAALPFGYHRLTVPSCAAETVLIVTPGSCWLPPSLGEGGRLWGVSAQLYLLRSAGNWGIGDFGDLRRLAAHLSARGADVIGLNPLHAMFLDTPEHASPYSPASRLLLNVLYIDVTEVCERLGSDQARAIMAAPDFRQRLAACRAAALVDYSTVADLKLHVLRALFDTSSTGGDKADWSRFQQFRRDHGALLERSCLFLALRQHFAGADWHLWPADYQTPNSEAVLCFAREHADLVTFQVWLQWLADRQLAEAAAAAGGMAVGLYRDLAVGADRAGAETWANPLAVVSGARVGAPPDIHNPAGQDWGLPPFHPRALREEAYHSFIQLVRANMRHAGGLRIDHVMALQHLYWVPEGHSPAEGAYVQYRLDDLVGILALESHRQKCLVVGEDLGTVPEGFRERMARANILSYRVLAFEQDAQGFILPQDYPVLSVAVAGSHDLPTVRGWWRERDIDLKQTLDLYPTSDGAEQARADRRGDRTRLLQALRRAQLLPESAELEDKELPSLVHMFLARSRSMLALAQLDDITSEVDPVNIPGTSTEHPNWRRRQSMTLEQLAEDPALEAAARMFASERPRGRS